MHGFIISASLLLNASLLLYQPSRLLLLLLQ
jgi:hypothetical protein